MKLYYVYIITNISNTTLYVGITNDLARRVFEHKNKLVDGFSKRYNLHKLIFYEITEDVEAAIAREKQLKNWSRNKKDRLIGDFNPELKDLYNEVIL